MQRRSSLWLAAAALLLLAAACTAAPEPGAAQLVFRAPMNIDSDQEFHVSLGVENRGDRRFRDTQGLNAVMTLRNAAGDEAGRVEMATLGELAPGKVAWPGAFAAQLPAGAYQLIWGAPAYGSVTADFPIVEREGRLSLGQEVIKPMEDEPAADGETYEPHAGDSPLVYAPTEEAAPEGSITIDEVQVDRGEQVVVRGASTLPDGTCLGSELWVGGAPQTWWPGDACVPVEGGAWQLTVALGEGDAPAELDASAHCMLRVFQQGGPNIVSVYPFDVAAP